MKERLTSKESHVPAAYGTKRKVKEIADLLGIKVPEVYFVGRLDEIVWDDLPEEFVVKPDFASTNIGVRLLSKDAESAGEHLIDIPSGERIEIAVLEEKFRDIAIRYYGEDHEKGIFWLRSFCGHRMGPLLLQTCEHIPFSVKSECSRLTTINPEPNK